MFGKMIRFMRFTKKLKQTELAEKLGIASSTLAHYESEYRAVTLETANEIAKLCDFELVFINKKDNIKEELYRDLLIALEINSTKKALRFTIKGEVYQVPYQDILYILLMNQFLFSVF